MAALTPARLLVAALVALALPGTARAGVASLVTRDVPVAGARSAAVDAPSRFDLAGVHWRGSGSVQLRARAVGGGWSAWHDAAPEDEDQPDLGTAEAKRARGWRIGNPWWVGPSDRIAVRTRGRVTAVRAFFVSSPEVRVPLRTTATADAPPIVPRVAWGANEALHRAEPDYAAELRFALVHHTAGANEYSRSEAAAIVRGIQLYHVRSNGWNDIGYNFLVDRFGTVYEGRYGGIDRNVIGAHALGFNTGSVGVALLGTYTDADPSLAAEKALAQLLAWRLDAAHIDPLTTLQAISGGNERFPEGLPVFLRAVSGHRDTGFTVCPGDHLYARLGRLASQAAAIGLPKLYEPRATLLADGQVGFRARLSASLPWKVTVTDAGGIPVATAEGEGSEIDWAWDATLAAAGPHTWRIEAGSPPRVATSATGTLGTAGPSATLAFSHAVADPETITPNEDAQTDRATVTYTITAPAAVGATVVDQSGVQVAELERPQWRRAGEHAIVFDGLGLPDGRYEVRLLARAADGAEASLGVPVAVTRTLASVALGPAVFSPNGDGRRDEVTLTFRLAQPAVVTVRVLRDGRWVATPFAGPLEAGPQVVRWNGAKRTGRLRDGPLSAVVEATDLVAITRIELPFSSDTRAPRLRLLSRRPPRLAVSEPARLTMRVNGAVRRVDVPAGGIVPIPGIEVVRTLLVVARDEAGNASAALRLP